MRCELNVKSHFYTLIIVLNFAWNFIRVEADPLFNPFREVPRPNIVNIKSANDFIKHVLNSNDSILAQFTAPPEQCWPCELQNACVELAVKKQKGKIKLANVNVRPKELDILAVNQGFRKIPSIATYKNGRIIDKMIGFHPYPEVLKFVQKQIGGGSNVE